MNSPPSEAGPATHRVYPAVQHPRPEAIVLHCSDPRFQPAFEQFIATELGLAKGEFMPLVVGAGAGALAHPEQLPKEVKFLKERFELYRECFPSIRRVVLINHEDCRYYAALKNRVFRFMGAHLPMFRQGAHGELRLAGQVFERLLAHLGLDLDLYYARFADAEHSRIVFEKLSR